LLKGSFSEVDAEDVVVEVICWEKSLEIRVIQQFDLVCELGVGVSVYDRDLVPFGVSIQIVVRMILRSPIP
jgi:hypothetical protein